MKLLAVRLARSICLVPTYFLNPRGVFMRPAIEAMKVRYSFLTTPLDGPIHPPANEGYKFELGAFEGKNGTVQITSMTTHGDGIVVDTRSSTDDADMFLEDIFAWANKEFGMPSLAELPVKRIYVSELNVAFSRAPIMLNPQLSSFVDDITSAFGDESKGKAEAGGFWIATDPTLSNKSPTFRIDREINTSFEENRFYSFAPTKTDVHLKLLRKFEKLAV